MENAKGIVIGEYSLSRRILKFLLSSVGLKNIDDMDCDCFFSNGNDCQSYSFVVFDGGIGDTYNLRCLNLIREKVPEHIPVIAFINQIDDEYAFSKVIKAGATLCLSKIFGIDIIEREIKGLLQAGANMGGYVKKNCLT